MVNTREYEWADISVIVAGRNVTGFRGIKFGAKQEKEALYAKGNKPYSIQRGNKSYDGEITLVQSEYEALRLAAGGDVLDISFDIVVAYGNPSKGELSMTKILKGVQLTESAEEWKQGDKFIEKRLPFIYLDQKEV